jgi:succinate dehydrogenase / fumarate reductase membrane anchor subunit
VSAPVAAWERPVRRLPAAEPRSRTLDYVLLRVTGLLLSVLVLGHFAVTHVVTDVADDNSAFVARRLGSALWIAWDSAMLAAALAHGAAGVRIALGDYLGGRPARKLLERGLAATVFLLFVVGTFAIARAAHA